MIKNTEHDVIIVGAGVAGISAAVHSIKNGKKPLLIEATANIGGRARSFIDVISGDSIDNGQHVMMGCYSAFIELIDILGMMDFMHKQRSLTIPFHFPDGENDVLRASVLGGINGPIGMAMGMLRLSFLSRKEKRSLMFFSLRLKLGMCKPGSMNALEFLQSESQSVNLISLIWTPVILATMNGKPEEVSAKIFMTVLQLAFFGKGDSSSLYIPTCGLSELLKPASDWLIQHGGSIMQSNGVRSIIMENDALIGVELSDGNILESSRIISAIPPHALQKIIPDRYMVHDYFSSLNSMKYSPIVSLYLWFDSSFPEIELAAIMHSSTHWIFPKKTNMNGAQSLLALTISAGDEIVSKSTEEIAYHCAEEVKTYFPEMKLASLLHWKVIKEKHATILIDPEMKRPQQQSPIEGLFLAGDWTETGLPATLEGAALSGKITASMI